MYSQLFNVLIGSMLVRFRLRPLPISYCSSSQRQEQLASERAIFCISTSEELSFSTQDRFDPITTSRRPYWDPMADSSSQDAPARPPSRSNRPMSEALLNEKVRWSSDARHGARCNLKSPYCKFVLTDNTLLVGSLPQYSSYPQHPRRVVRCHIFGSTFQAESVAGTHRLRIWCGKSVGRM